MSIQADMILLLSAECILEIKNPGSVEPIYNKITENILPDSKNYSWSLYSFVEPFKVDTALPPQWNANSEVFNAVYE